MGAAKLSEYKPFEIPEKYKNCALCSYADFSYLKDDMTVTMKNGSIVKLNVFADAWVNEGYLYIIIDGWYQGCYEVKRAKTK
jgi:hypothetical protein